MVRRESFALQDLDPGATKKTLAAHPPIVCGRQKPDDKMRLSAYSFIRRP
jgi:hypothetical protein